MKAQYLLRFDDICPTMNWPVWDAVEAILCDRQIDPMLAVVPDNRDEKLQVSPPDEHFWDRVRNWQSRGWTIAMHGWQHRLETKNGGIIGLNKVSEFAGFPECDQEAKLRAGLKVLRSEGITSDLWIAPAHSFDHITVKLLSQLGFRYISDGFSPLPHVDEFGMTWVPQQLWSFRRRPFGVWTICFHINRWTSADVLAFRENTLRYTEAISSLRAILSQFAGRRKTLLDDVAERAYRFLATAKPAMQRLGRSFTPDAY
jgi:predicted deacetylase